MVRIRSDKGTATALKVDIGGTITNLANLQRTTISFVATSTSTTIKILPTTTTIGLTYYVDEVEMATDHLYSAVVFMKADYYPFGMEMPGRTWQSDAYRYGYNGMEKDNEVKGNGNSYSTEFRQYDPRLGRWLSLDPLMMQFPWMSPYVAFDNNPIYYIDPLGLKGTNPEGEEPYSGSECDDGRIVSGEMNGESTGGDGKVRLYIINQNCQIKGDNQSFWDASKRIQQFHSGSDGNWDKIGNRKAVSNGGEIRNYINSQKPNSICSVDFFSHGGSEGLWFQHETINEVYTNSYFQLDLKYLNFYTSEKDYEESDNRYDNDIKSNFKQLSNSSSLDALDYGNFTKDCRIEVHGCGTGGDGYSDKGGNIFCSEFSKKLYKAGKTSAVVIGHYGPAGPYYPDGVTKVKIDGKEVNLGVPDYRQNERRVYWNGNLILTTFNNGNIDQKSIDDALLLFNTEGKATSMP